MSCRTVLDSFCALRAAGNDTANLMELGERTALGSTSGGAGSGILARKVVVGILQGGIGMARPDLNLRNTSRRWYLLCATCMTSTHFGKNRRERRAPVVEGLPPRITESNNKISSGHAIRGVKMHKGLGRRPVASRRQSLLMLSEIPNVTFIRIPRL